jgi:hypothetical protein
MYAIANISLSFFTYKFKFHRRNNIWFSNIVNNLNVL